MVEALVPQVNRIHAQIAVLGIDAALRHRASAENRFTRCEVLRDWLEFQTRLPLNYLSKYFV